MSVGSHADVYAGGRVVGSGTFVCRGCGSAVSVDATDQLPDCCDEGYRRASLFEQPTDDTSAVEFSSGEPWWLQGARARVGAEGVYVALEEGGRVRVEALTTGWTRIGRSAAADVRLDDPTVSRRHAQVVRTETDEVRVIDDRSLNGVFVNGSRIEWSPLSDGDELAIGRYRLRILGANPPGDGPNDSPPPQPPAA
ncbi:MAG: FHA domain-containing protein [Solirubrobacterales bacterium]